MRRAKTLLLANLLSAGAWAWAMGALEQKCQKLVHSTFWQTLSWLPRHGQSPITYEFGAKWVMPLHKLGTTCSHFGTYHHTLESFVLTALNSRCHANYKVKMPKSSFACFPLQHPPIRNPRAYLCPDLLSSAQHQTSRFAPISCLVTYYLCLSLLVHSCT